MFGMKFGKESLEISFAASISSIPRMIVVRPPCVGACTADAQLSALPLTTDQWSEVDDQRHQQQSPRRLAARRD